MNREEAIKNLEMISVAFVDSVTKEQRKLIDDTFDIAIKALEQEPQTGHWIPVSERLPERSVWVLAYCKTKDGYEYQAVLLLSKYNGEWTDCDDFCDDVIAWMPLPEPYKAESEDKNE